MVTYSAFCILGVICIGLQYAAIKSRNEPSVGNNPTFLQFQREYFAAYFPAILADWLQGPYLYKLYHHYGFEEDQIAVLYVCGFASTVLLGTWAPIAADRYGRQKLCMMFTVIYSLACLFKLSQNYGILILGRVLGGMATSLLFSAFEAWYITEHIEKHDFPKEWIGVTFSKATVWNGVLAIVAGFIANIVAEWFGFGPVSPFMLAIPCLVVSGVVVSSKWPENYSKQQVLFKKSCSEGLQKIATEPRIFLIGIIQSLFESVMYIFVFIWTPVLDDPKGGTVSLGIIFSSFMVCIMIGSSIYQLLTVYRVNVLYMLASSIGLALVSNIICVIATPGHDPQKVMLFTAFLVIEIAVGIYFPAITHIRSRLVPEATRRSILNWFRVPLNLIACAVLMMLHNDSFHHGNRLIFGTCTGLLVVACLCVIQFISMVKDDEELNEEGTVLETA